MSDLAKKARTAVAWTAGLNILRDVVQFVQMLVVVRLLPPEAYGQYGLNNTIIAFMVVFSSREFIAHTVLERDDAALNYQEQFTAGCVIQGALFLLANGVAVGMRWFPTYAPIAPLLHLTSFLFLVDLPSELRARMLERRMDWQRLRSVEGVGILIGTALTMALAWSGAGVYALVIPLFVLPGAFAVDLLLIERWRPSFVWHSDRYRTSRRFGLNRIMSLSMVSGSNLVESSVMARVVGYTVLGLFGRAIGMAMLFCLRVASLLMSAIYPVLARISPGTDTYQRVSSLVLRVVLWMVIPIAVGLSLLRHDVVQTLYGSRWLSVIPLVPEAMAVGVLLAAVQAVYSLLLASQQARKCFYADVWRLVGMTIGVVIALPFGIEAYLASLIVVHAVAFVAVVTWLAQIGGIRVSGVVAAIAPALAAVVLAVLVAETTRALVLSALPPIPRMAAYITVFAVTYLAALRLLFASLLREVINYFPKADHVHRFLGYAQAS
jgi:PST family polysaccharide transporter/lipopolysaccharide exporter